MIFSAFRYDIWKFVFPCYIFNLYNLSNRCLFSYLNYKHSIFIYYFISLIMSGENIEAKAILRYLWKEGLGANVTST